MSNDRGKARAFDEGWGLTPKEKERLAAEKSKQQPRADAVTQDPADSLQARLDALRASCTSLNG